MWCRLDTPRQGFAGSAFGGSARRAQVIAAGWQAIGMFEQNISALCGRLQVRQPSVHSWQVLSLSP
jgi:hypothetical protein